MFRKNVFFEREQDKYDDEAKDYLGNQQKTQQLLNKARKKAQRKKGNLGDAWNKLQLFIDLVKAYSKGEYRNVSTKTIITVIGALLYFVSPLDLIPDFLLGIGFIDDAAVIGYALKKISTEIDAFSVWKMSGRY
ncbi:YkvA family protein [Neobacillus novalis]|uniref:YkvA family protein n=1 Tax=Neobacillus novalis TaxID=220687 RepID=A0AA95MX64_9BACI|nr:YkvA family protein [Neobacillus novalis]WHY87858.1 YkvA family protein [Neobacillus novalis]